MTDSAQGDGRHFDLLIVDDDIALGATGCEQHIDGRPSIAQDTLHMIRDTGLLRRLIGERDSEKRQAILIELVEAIEDDERIIPGTARITESNPEKYWIEAQTEEYHQIGFWL